MIIVGDIASPNPKCSADLERIFHRYADLFSSQALICNLEGLLCDDISTDTSTPVLFNHSSVLQALRAANIKVAALANNHTLDLPKYYDATVRSLSNSGIMWCGAGRTKEEAETPISFMDDDVEIVLFNFCWDFLLYHQKNPSAGICVAEIDNVSLVNEVKKVHASKPDARIVIFLHWSFDLEVLPFPMYRKLAMNLVEAGANVVVGTHSHCVQGGEKYKDCYILYGLGNFFLPYNTFANGRLTFPEFSRLQMAFQWAPRSNRASCHWFEYQNQTGVHSLIQKETAAFEESELLKKYSPFGNSLDEYAAYFKGHRRKRFLIPIYLDPDAVWRNTMYTRFLKLRGRLARSLAKLRIRKWQS